VADELEISPTAYEEAEKRYKSLGEWLDRDGSTLKAFRPTVYVQGSFRLGTAIRPFNDGEEYDIDSVCELERLDRSKYSQAQLKALVGGEIESYRRAHSMSKPLKEGTRCWVLSYAEGAQFHMDIVPAVPNPIGQRILLEYHGHDARWTGTAIVITCQNHANYQRVSDDWPRSNPKGYAAWFKSRMAVTFEKRRRALAEAVHATVEDIPDYRVRTPLQSAVMILKHHRDRMFAGQKDIRPISVIITTLSAHSYEGEEGVAQALLTILSNMESHIQHDGQKYIIPNPTDQMENFADKWEAHPERATAFFKWLEQARQDFSQAAALIDRQLLTETLQQGLGVELAKRASSRLAPPGGGGLRAASVAPVAAIPSFSNQPRVPNKPQGFA
jgi:hypothetical protein